MQKNLAEDFQQVRDSLDQTERLKQRAQANFEAVEKENFEDKKKYEQQITQLEQLLGKLQQELSQSKNENAKLKSQVQTTRKQDQENLRLNASSNPETAAIEKAIKDNRAKVNGIEQEVRQELSLKEKALSRFDQIDNQFKGQRQNNEKQLRDQENERRVL